MDVVLYTKDDCPYCEKIKTVLTIQNVPYVEYKLGQHFDRSNFISEFGEGSTFPRVLINGNLIGGASDTVQYLKENGIV